MRRRVLWFASLCLLVILSTSLWRMARQRDAAEEYAVYDAAIGEGRGSSKPFLILDATTTKCPLDSDTLAYIKKRYADSLPSQDMVRDYNAKNKKPQRLERRFKIKGLYTLVSRRELGRLVGTDSTETQKWEKLPLADPRARQTAVELSRPGFNRRRDQAIAYVESVAPEDAHAGWYAMLEKARGKWRVRSEIVLWTAHPWYW